jgi:hypothetical protein
MQPRNQQEGKISEGEGMEAIRRKMTVFTPGKQYSGEVDIPNASLRTTDLLNSTNLYWKDPSEKNFNDVLLMFNVTLSIDGIREFQKFDRVQIRQPNIIFFHDDYANLGSDEEKKRADALKKKTHEEKKIIHLITKIRVNSFFDIKGSFFGLFKSKSIQKYIPLTDVVMYEITRQQDKWVKKKIQLANNFIGVNTSHIETCAL